MITFIDASVADFARQERLAGVARARLIQSATRSAPAPAARTMARVRAYARYALSALAAVAFGMSTN